MWGMGHAGAAFAVAALVLSAAFLVWVGDKAGNPYQKMGKVFGAIALAVSSLLVVGALFSCIEMRVSGTGKSCPMMQGMMPGYGMGMPGMGYGPGARKWRHHQPGMGRGMEPMPAPETPEQPEE